MTAPFEPADGVEARWKKVYHRLKGMKTGDVLTYTTLAEMFPGLDRHGLQSVIRRAQKELLEENKRGLKNVRGQGYRVIDPSEHMHIARWHQERSLKSLRRGHAVVKNVDYNGMPQDVRSLTEATLRALGAQIEFNTRMDVRQTRLEAVVEQTVDRTEANEQQLKELHERLERIEKGK